jgi:hypothetical protein
MSHELSRMASTKNGHDSSVPIHAEAVAPAKAGRASMIFSSRQALRELGHHDRYMASITSVERAIIDEVVPGMWVPISTICAHYEVCERIGLTVAEQIEMGRHLSKRMHHPVFAVGLRLAGAAGVTPWHLARQGEKVWSRMWDGGAFVVSHLGSKEALIEILGFPPAMIPYSRVSWRGVILGGAELLSRRAYVNEVPARCSSTSLGFRLSWA